ncbi:replicative DNA helicase [Corynebacterium glyciniphilum]|uniref:replicative DNA helicase n=1 Tax=Corynebacterium glyciniphilum TaxID=1404244 RepID=UPI002654165D|nr:replicative DNA helicase [Corynebacterium glyciniphilum]MDN6706401.1 replicative DNA helicase [Corynebacterium glyciniphilum]
MNHNEPQLPHAEESERALIGALMMDTKAVTAAADLVQPKDCFYPANQAIFEAILNVWARGDSVDPVVVVGELDARKQLDKVGGAPYIHDLYSRTPIAANVDYYASAVTSTALLRRLVQAGQRINQIGMTAPGDEVDAAVDQAQRELAGVSRSTSNGTQGVGTYIDEVMDELEAIANGTPSDGKPHATGYRDLDDLTNGGLRGKQMVIVAARPGVGKSTAGVDFMRQVSIRDGKASVIFSLEMSAAEVTQRILSAESGVPMSKMKTGKMSDLEWNKLAEACAPIGNAPLFIDDSYDLTMMSIRSKARRLAQAHDLGLIVVDYLQLLSSGRKVESRQQEVSEFSRQLKLLAKELEVPVVAISQLNRGVEARGDDAKPRISDLRESGSLEQDADMVMLIHRPDSKDQGHERAGEADIILAKHRGGPIGTVTLANRLNVCQFSNLVNH